MKFIAILLLSGLFCQTAFGQADEPVRSDAPVALRPVSDEQWRAASDDLDYSDDQPREPRKKRRPRDASSDTSTSDNRDWTFSTGAWGSVLQIIAIVLAALGIAFGIYKMLAQPRNRAIARDGVEITLDNIEEYLHETDLDRFLRAALADGKYALAVRLYYLQAIKDLSAVSAIHWSREKTNRDYLREMRPHRLAEPFRSVTRHFEHVWYGNIDLGEPDFRRLEPEFKDFLARIN